VQFETTAVLDALSFAVRWDTNCLRLKDLSSGAFAPTKWEDKGEGADFLMLREAEILFHQGHPTTFLAFDRLRPDCNGEPFLWGAPLLPQAAWKGAHSLPCAYSTSVTEELMELETVLTLSPAYGHPKQNQLYFYAQPFYTNAVRIEVSNNLVAWSSTTNPATVFIPTNSSGNIFFRYSREMPETSGP
jgi:hypothetical protein